MMEKINTNIVTLTRFLTEEQIKHKEATGDFTYGTLLPCPMILPIGTNTMSTASSATRSSSRSSPSPTTSGARRSST